jgi:trk system potassium uptake protein TrkH
MSGFDAIAHSFTTVSTGGFSTYDASMGHFQSPLILWIANIFMLLGAISFSLHYRIYKTRHPLLYWQDEETRVFLLLVILISSLLAVFLWYKSLYPSFFESVTQATFLIISFMTSTGYGAGNFGEWSEAAVLLLIMVGYIGGCAGSTAGGNKVIRGVISFKVIMLEIKKLVHPSGVFTMKFQSRPVNDDIRNAVMAFVYIVFVMTFLFTFLLMLTGVDLLTAFSATAACLNVLGPGFGDVGSNFAPLNDVATWLLIVAMILGRLEYFTVIVLFFPLLWNR